MKIGILTFHYTINQGSVIQSFCVQNLMQEWFPTASVEVINIVPLMREKHEWRFYTKKFPFLKIEKYKKYKSIRKFVKQHLNCSRRVYYNNLTRQIKYINKQHYDIVCTGSDTVWVDSHRLKHQIPNIYFLPEEIVAKKISVAASVDPLNNEERYMQKKDTLSKIWDGYKLISVRDKGTVNLVSQITSNNINLIADPTILFAFEKKLNLAIRKDFRNNGERRIAIAISDYHLTEVLKTKLLKYGETYNSFYTKKTGYDYVLDELNDYRNWDVVITDRFHRSIFALKLSSALIINVEREDKNKKTNSKGRELFQNIGISEYALRYKKNEENLFVEKIEILLNEWDENKLNTRDKQFNNYITNEKLKWGQIKEEVLPLLHKKENE